MQGCIHCGQLLFRKISKFDATSCQILRLKCTKFDFHWGCASYPTGAAYSAPPNLLAVFKGPVSKGRDGVEGGKEKDKDKGRGRDLPDQCQTASYTPARGKHEMDKIWTILRICCEICCQIALLWVLLLIFHYVICRHLLSIQSFRTSHWLLERYSHQYFCQTFSRCQYSCFQFWWTSLWMHVLVPARSWSFWEPSKSTTSAIISSRHAFNVFIVNIIRLRICCFEKPFIDCEISVLHGISR